MTQTWTIGPADGELLLKTDKTGPAAKTGHRLTIGFNDWTGSVDVDDTTPQKVSLAVVVDSMEVLSGEGGLTPMTGAEKAIARSNALKSLKASKSPTITFTTSNVSPPTVVTVSTVSSPSPARPSRTPSTWPSPTRIPARR